MVTFTGEVSKLSDKKRSFSNSKLKNIVLISLFTAIIAACSLITLPFPVPFTLQTLGIFSALLILGGKNGTIAISIYIAVGLVGIPVFSGFSAGIGHLMGATGGYVIGFLLTALSYWLITAIFGNKTVTKVCGLALGLILCYTAGVIWYTTVYLRDTSLSAVTSALTIGVVPFIIPDIIKLTVAILIDRKLKIIKN
jgi:biotin transport system substrate-specific component